MEEELYKWYPIIDEGEYWTDYDTSFFSYKDVDKIGTIVSNGTNLYTFDNCTLSWSTMAKSGEWKYMRILL